MRYGCSIYHLLVFFLVLIQLTVSPLLPFLNLFVSELVPHRRRCKRPWDMIATMRWPRRPRASGPPPNLSPRLHRRRPRRRPPRSRTPTQWPTRPRRRMLLSPDLPPLPPPVLSPPRAEERPRRRRPQMVPRARESTSRRRAGGAIGAVSTVPRPYPAPRRRPRPSRRRRRRGSRCPSSRSRSLVASTPRRASTGRPTGIRRMATERSRRMRRLNQPRRP